MYPHRQSSVLLVPLTQEGQLEFLLQQWSENPSNLLINGQIHMAHGRTLPSETVLNALNQRLRYYWIELVHDTMWFLAQDYLAHIHNLGANRQIYWKMSEQVSKGGHQISPIS
jgi:hypothetical protein